MLWPLELRCWKFHPEIAQRDAKADDVDIEEVEGQNEGLQFEMMNQFSNRNHASFSPILLHLL